MEKIYSYDEAFQSSLRYFNGDDLAANVFLSKYALRNNNEDILEDSPVKMHQRLASEFARIESKKFKNPLTEKELFNLFDKFERLIPQGSPMFGIGNNFQTISISNCFVLDSPEDSYNSILDVDKQLVNISKRRGGVGIDLSKLRPKGSVTNNASKSSTGIVSWMERYSNSIREVGQHGRRGALMLTLDVHHPDVLDFTTVKNDNTKVTGANISLRLSKEFLDAVKNDEEYELRFPVDYHQTGVPAKVSKKVKAKEIWSAIIHSAWLRAEPGLLMWDNVLGGPADCYDKYKAVSTNPCVTGDTKVLTKKGNKRIDKLVGKKIEVWNGFEWSLVEPRITGFNKEITEVTLSNGKKLKCTANHNFILADENRIQCKDLKVGDILFGGKDSYTNRVLRNPSIVSLKLLPKLAEAVYCFTEPKRNLGTFNDILTGQCSEIAMCSLESCRLLAINLFGYVKEPFTKNAYFDYDYFFSDTKLAQRLMDDIVDLESEKIDQILEKIKNDPENKEVKEDEINLWKRIKKLNNECRRTGLGITALGDTLAAVGIKYGSEESVKETEKIYKTLKLAAYESSVEMAEELGCFQDYDSEIEENNDFIQTIKKENSALYYRMIKSGRRNIALTTTAPTGSVSIMSQTSSGIEPVFNLGYKRRKKINPNDKNTKVDFTDQNGDSWQEFMVYHPKLKLWMEITGKDNIEKSPWFGATANEIDWLNRVGLQAAAQKHVCHAISSTLNLPENVTEEKVAEIYETAFASGVKGITIYRENCRTGVLVNSTEKKDGNKIIHTTAPKRPRDLKCDVHHITYQDNRYYVVIGLIESEPYECFIGLNNDGEGDVVIPKSIKQGLLIKEGKGKYVLKTDDYSCLLKNTNTDENADSLARLLSTALRHGSPLPFLLHQLEKTKGNLTSFSKVLCRVLKKYVKDGTEITGEVCPDCSGKLIRNSGCVICSSCGWSKC